VTSFDAVVSTTGVVAYTKQGQPTQSLMRAGTAVRTAPWCGDDLPFESIQFLGRTNAVVYQSGCAVPSADIYSVAPDGTGLQHVTTTPQHEFSPSLSPDGSRVAYAQQVLADRCEGCPQSLWATPSKQLTSRTYTDDAPFDDHPSWSPDGSTIVFDRSGANTPPTLYTLPAAGGAAKSLGVQGTHPVWGPKLIAFDSDGGLATLDPATGDVKTVAGTRNRNVVAAAWSSDGRLAYLTPGRITIAGGPTIPVPKPHATALAWSPDGTRFAFAAADTNGNGEIYTIAVDGSGLRQVTKDLDVIGYDGSIGWR
jgi:dipeptidyl aminopeptidase/acylaminoacyl peptidase